MTVIQVFQIKQFGYFNTVAPGDGLKSQISFLFDAAHYLLSFHKPVFN